MSAKVKPSCDNCVRRMHCFVSMKWQGRFTEPSDIGLRCDSWRADK